MPPRDTVIDVEDGRLGYKARIVVFGGYIDTALSDKRDTRGRLVDEVLRARSHICQQAKAAMVRRGRSRSQWLHWDDIAMSVCDAEPIKVDPPRKLPAKSSPTQMKPAAKRKASSSSPAPPAEDQQPSTPMGQLVFRLEPPGQSCLFEA